MDGQSVIHRVKVNDQHEAQEEYAPPPPPLSTFLHPHSSVSLFVSFPGRSETDFRDIAEDMPTSPVIEPPPLSPRGFIRSISLGGEDKSVSLAHIGRDEGEETDLDALPVDAPAQKSTSSPPTGDGKLKDKKLIKIKKKEVKKTSETQSVQGTEKFPGEYIVVTVTPDFDGTVLRTTLSESLSSFLPPLSFLVP